MVQVPIDFPAMSDFDHKDGQDFFVKGVDHPEGVHLESPKLGVVDQGTHAGGFGVGGQAVHCGSDFFLQWSVQFFQLANSGRPPGYGVGVGQL